MRVRRLTALWRVSSGGIGELHR